ncbi:hypothetical protein LTR10_010421 [Elasticomyces elasticus]|nr:hypothetical protein LTR10_010421 [Elasticomyces elasticus]KAK4972322.1 hypothetical protein LTR42_006829 [Elasticomyces elasticus]
MAFQAWAYVLMFFGIVAMNHKYGESYEEVKARQERRRERTLTRMEKARAAENKADEEAKERRRMAREKRRQEEERLEAIREKERRWMYGHHERR